MPIDKSCDPWKGTSIRDIEEFLRAFTSGPDFDPTVVYRSIECPCGSSRFRLERAGEVTRRTCVGCSRQDYICRTFEDWDEAEYEQGIETFACLQCQSSDALIVVGFAAYDEIPWEEALKWYYVGTMCAACGALNYFNDGKIANGPASEVFSRI
jgi:hypothetical protein